MPSPVASNEGRTISKYNVSNVELRDEIWHCKVINAFVEHYPWHSFDPWWHEITDSMESMTIEGNRYRIADDSYVPLTEKGKYKGIRKITEPMPAFRIFEVRNGIPTEIMRSNWVGDLDTGHYRQKEELELTDNLWKLVYKMIKGMKSKHNYKGYPNDMVNDAAIQMARNVLKFNDIKTNEAGNLTSAYAYLYSGIEKMFWNFIRKQKQLAEKELSSPLENIDDTHNGDYSNFYDEVDIELKNAPEPSKCKSIKITNALKAQYETPLSDKGIKQMRKQQDDRKRAIANNTKYKVK